jgi:hypothetical protein
MSNASASTKSMKKLKTVVPSKNPEDVLQRQKNALIENINEAKAAEEKRLLMLSKAPPSRLPELRARHDAERERDKVKIERLCADLSAIQNMAGSGSLDISARNRRFALPPKDMGANRFDQEKLRLMNEVWIQRLDNLEKRFEASRRPRFNEYEEKKKVTINCNLDF